MRLLTVLLLVSCFLAPQDDKPEVTGIEKGQIFGNRYRSIYFGFEMQFPKEWEGRLDTFLSGPDLRADGLESSLLFGAKPHNSQGEGPPWIAVHAFRKKAGVEAEAFLRGELERLANETTPHALVSEDFKVTRQPTAVAINGKDFIRAEYRTTIAFGGSGATAHGALLATEAREHIVLFAFLTITESEFAELMALSEAIAGWSATGVPLRVRVSQGVMQKNAMTQPPPVYPPEARRLGVTGAVVMRVVIGTDGMVKGIDVISGNPLLTDAAVLAVRNWHYRPYALNKEPVEVETQIMINFTLGR